MERVTLIAGGSGRLGREMARLLHSRGDTVRALLRSPRRQVLVSEWADQIVIGDARHPPVAAQAMAGVDRVFSCLGASVIPMPGHGRETFTRVDYPANAALIGAARAEAVSHFVYVSVFGHRKLPDLNFIRGHEAVVEELRGSGLRYGVVRPTGFFSSMEEILLVASRGLVPEFNGGSARTNPIHEADLAQFCLDAFDQPSGYEADVGGPDDLTRREIAALAWRALGREGRSFRAPVGLLKAGGVLLRPVSPRVADLYTFIAEILSDDFVAPCYGRRRMADYFVERAAELQARPAAA